MEGGFVLIVNEAFGSAGQSSVSKLWDLEEMAGVVMSVGGIFRWTRTF